ncbi:uncharacterized protein [Garra rufa]|uniref:uncharacterized protein n=1 Tax=Garra rufa TaxID=137080 RepID=UPI003CCEAD49
MDGDSFTLRTNVETKQEEDIKWYFYDTRIAQITGDFSFICTDVQCNNGTERFGNRLKLDHQTGSLTILNINTNDTGLYELKIISTESSSEKTFSVTVHGVPVAEQDEMKRKSVNEGESVTLEPGVLKNPNDLMTWHFNGVCIAEISKEPGKICTDVQCKNGDERFKNRLKVDHQTGSLTITNTTITDSGVYQLQISSSGFSVMRSFSVTITDSSLSSAVVAGICAAAAAAAAAAAVVLLLLAAISLVYYKNHIRRKGTWMQHSDQVNTIGIESSESDLQANGAINLSPTQSDISVVDEGSETPSNHNDALLTNTTNDFSSNRTEVEIDLDRANEV